MLFRLKTRTVASLCKPLISCIPRRNSCLHDKKSLLEEYASLLNCDLSSVIDVAVKDSRLVNGTCLPSHVSSVMAKALEYGYTAEDICKTTCWLKCAWDRVDTRLKEMDRYKIWGLSTLRLPEKEYRIIVKQHRQSESIPGSRLSTLASLLDCSTNEIRDHMKTNFSLERKPLYILVHYITVLKEHGLTSADIRQNISLFMRNLPDVMDRISVMDTADFRNFQKFSVSLLRCSSSTFHHAIENYKKDLKALNSNKDVVEFLMDKLEWSKDDVISRYKTCSGFRNRPSYIASMLDLLMGQYGISEALLMRRYSLFNYSVERHRRRLKVLHSLGVTHEEEVAACLLLSEKKFTRRYCTG